MKLWMDVMRDVEHLIYDYNRLFDAWEAGNDMGSNQILPVSGVVAGHV